MVILNDIILNVPFSSIEEIKTKAVMSVISGATTNNQCFS